MCFQKGTLPPLNTLDSSGKPEGNSLQNCPVLSVFPWASWNLVFSSMLHCKSISSICNKSGTLSTPAKKGSENSWKVSWCALKSAKHWSNSCSRFSIAEVCSSPLMSSCTRDLHAVKWLRFLAESSFPQSQFCGEGFHTLTRALELQVNDVQLLRYVHKERKVHDPFRIIKFRNVHSAIFHESLHLCS